MALAAQSTIRLKAPRSIARRNHLFAAALAGSTVVVLAVLVIIVADLVVDAAPVLGPQIVTNYPSQSLPGSAGARSAIVGTLWLIATTALLAIPIGIGAAIYLEEFAPKNRLTRAIETNIANLAGVPSVVYGLLGLGIFVRTFQMGRIVLVGAVTLALLVLPIVIIASREALRAVPAGIREGAFALGATPWEVVREQVIPAAVPGMMTGTILALSRAIGEAAPLATLGVFIIRWDPTPFSLITSLPTQILAWVIEAKQDFAHLAAAASIVLLLILLSMNAIAIWLRNRYRREW
jgi:phosphate transport system permease protein